jgi:hypothetical protein
MHRPGLKHIPTERLRGLLRALETKRLVVPLTPAWLMMSGYSDIADEVPILFGLDDKALRAALVIALAERSVTSVTTGTRS